MMMCPINKSNESETVLVVAKHNKQQKEKNIQKAVNNH